MKKFTFTSLIATVLACGVAASPASAQDATADPAPAAATLRVVEVTPFVSLDSRGSTPIGVAISFPMRSNFSIESEVGYRHGEGRLNLLSSSANLLYALPRMGRTTPYLATGAGLAQYGAPVFSRDGSVLGTERSVTFEVNAGGGLKVPVSDALAMRTDARWFQSFGRDKSEHWRVSHGVSFGAGKR